MPAFFSQRRTTFLAIMTLVIMAIFVVRLFQLQIIHHEDYVALASNEQTRKKDLPATRGEIYTLDGEQPTKLVLNMPVYTVWADPSVIKDTNRVSDLLQRVAGGNVVDDMRGKLAQTASRYQVLARNVSYTQASEIKKEDIYGIGFTQGDKRIYPEGALASQVLGFVDGEGSGKYGVESKLDDRLKGRDGVLKTVADVRDVPLTIGKDNISIPPVNGEDIVLTIDRNVQSTAEKTLKAGLDKIGATYGSLLVMDPRNGHVLAMANYPTFDPNDLATITDFSLLNNHIISSPYEPASVIKTLTMSAGVQEGTIAPSTTYYNAGSIQVQDRVINNASKSSLVTGRTITMQDALDWSLNTGTVTMAQMMGGGSINTEARQTLYGYYHDKFRLGEPTGIELANESGGTVISPDQLEGNEVRYANMTFGQGLDVTTLQVASAFCSIVNGGIYHTPTVVAGTMQQGAFVPDSAKPSSRVLSETTSATMRQMTEEARQKDRQWFGSQDTGGFAVGGKTGTAQTIENGTYTFDTTTGTYVGYGGTPGETPSYVVMAFVGKPGTQLGGAQAGELFTPMSNWMISYLKLMPKG